MTGLEWSNVRPTTRQFVIWHMLIDSHRNNSNPDGNNYSTKSISRSQRIKSNTQNIQNIKLKNSPESGARMIPLKAE